MESPPSYSTHSEAPVISEDSGLIITSGSISSDSASGWHHITSELQESDYDEKSLSFCESTEPSERMCGDNFNTVKKGPGKVILTTIEPPPEFQDNPIDSNNTNLKISELIENAVHTTLSIQSCCLDIPRNTIHTSPIYSKKLKPESLFVNSRFTSPRLLHLSPCRARPSSRNSLSSRLSSSHNSLVTPFRADDSSFITQAISHDTLSAKTSDITDMYNVPFDSDIYAVPIDMVKSGQGNLRHKGKKTQRYTRKRGKSSSQINPIKLPLEQAVRTRKESLRSKDSRSKRHSLPGSSMKKINDSDSDSLHLTLKEMRKYLHTLYSSSSDSENKNTLTHLGNYEKSRKYGDKDSNRKKFGKADTMRNVEHNNNDNTKTSKNPVGGNIKNQKHKENTTPKDTNDSEKAKKELSKSTQGKSKSSPVRMLSINLKQSFCNLFRWRRNNPVDNGDIEAIVSSDTVAPAAVRRALPPLPQAPQTTRRSTNEDETIMDFATSIQKVKDHGWYWGNICVEAAEKILSNEPDGSFIVRDSSDDHYIFTLTFKLNGLRHVRIEHDQGNFCFGGTMFKAQTIVEFIENAVETSRSGRYLFFLNLRPVLGPVRVQLLYPVSRFKRVQSLQHMCRFVILKHVRKDLISSLPLPRRLLDYLNATHYYSELLADS